ncbi:hypothetical protein MPDQ_004987 [Monascus purpureus]|uniref:Extracellular membrane protein CFEM domain-containing protein n=1 Tax=Monascus purpureus TaxID=5098 RepID=A0A507R0L8_MONPU|nr:hypothetical protein MPDQ_004987 [Monascus purpureus]BDD54486.1 hypothetical protein MAP00_000101 [Monascus purpureus]
MKLNIIALSSLLVLAAAQDTTAVAPTTTASLSPEASCAAKCDNTNLCCIAGCYHVPCPNHSQANQNNDCVARCPQGSGTPADATAYALCEQGCISTHYFPITGTGAAAATDSSPSSSDATATASNAATTDSSSTASGSRSGSSTGSSTASASTSTHTDNAASNLQLGTSAVGILGLVMAVLAL